MQVLRLTRKRNQTDSYLSHNITQYAHAFKTPMNELALGDDIFTTNKQFGTTYNKWYKVKHC